MCVHLFGLYRVLLREFSIFVFDIALQLTKLLLEKVTTTTQQVYRLRRKSHENWLKEENGSEEVKN